MGLTSERRTSSPGRSRLRALERAVEDPGDGDIHQFFPREQALGLAVVRAGGSAWIRTKKSEADVLSTRGAGGGVGGLVDSRARLSHSGPEMGQRHSANCPVFVLPLISLPPL